MLRGIDGGWFGGIPWHWDRITIAATGNSDARVGRSIAEIAAGQGVAPSEVLLDLCAEFGCSAQAVLHHRQERDMAQ